MATAIIMPRQGQSVGSCVITSWNKKVGDSVKVGDVLFSYETDKSSFDLTAEVNMFNTANIQTIRRRFKTEYFALREMFLNVGRITSFAILLICSALWGFESLKYFILLLLFFWFGMGLNAVLLNKKLLKEEW